MAEFRSRWLDYPVDAPAMGVPEVPKGGSGTSGTPSADESGRDAPPPHPRSAPASAVLRAVAVGGRIDPSDVRRWVRENGLSRDRAAAYLERVGPVTVDEVAQRLRIPQPAALAALRALAADGRVERCPVPVGGTGLWRVPGSETATS